MGTRKANAMSSGLRHYERAAKASKHQAPHAADNKVNIIGMCDIYIKIDTCCSGKNWRLLSTTGQLCDIKVFHNSYKAITNVPVGLYATSVVYDDGTVYIIILNEALFFGNYMDHSLINQNKRRSFGIPVSNDPFERTR